MKVLFSDVKSVNDSITPELDDAFQRVLRSGRFILGHEGESFVAEHCNRTLFFSAVVLVGIANFPKQKRRRQKNADRRLCVLPVSVETNRCSYSSWTSLCPSLAKKEPWIPFQFTTRAAISTPALAHCRSVNGSRGLAKSRRGSYVFLGFLLRRKRIAALKVAGTSTPHPLEINSPGSGASRDQVNGFRRARR